MQSHRVKNEGVGILHHLRGRWPKSKIFFQQSKTFQELSYHDGSPFPSFSLYLNTSSSLFIPPSLFSAFPLRIISGKPRRGAVVYTPCKTHTIR